MRFLLLCIGILLVGCIEEIIFERPDAESSLVVDGVILRGNGQQTLKFSESSKLGSSVFKPVETIFAELVQENGSRYQYIYTGDGVYIIGEGIATVEAGETWFIEFSYRSDTYRSAPEVIPPPQETGTLKYRIASGTFFLEIENTVPENHKLYLKWNVHNIYAVYELFCSPFSLPKACYVTDPFQNQTIYTFDATRLSSGSTFGFDIAEKEIDDTFGNPQSFFVTQQSISKSAMDYWNRVDLVSNPSGNVFDPVPAAVSGNIQNISNPSEIVLGYVAAVAQDTAVLFTTQSDFYPDYPVLPYCGVPGFPRYSPECCNCLLLPFSTTIKPEYW